MKRTSNLTITTAAAALSALALSLAALSAAGAPKTHEERGTIKSVDASEHKLVVTDRKDMEHKFQWNDQTKFTEHGKAASPTDLKVGEQVRLSYKQDGDMPTLEHVYIAPAKAEKHSEKTAPSSPRSQNTLTY